MSERSAISELVTPFRETAAEAARLLKHLGARLDVFSLELARDLGAVSRDAQAFAGGVRDQAVALRRATPRAAKLAQPPPRSSRASAGCGSPLRRAASRRCAKRITATSHAAPPTPRPSCVVASRSSASSRRAVPI